MVQLRAPPLAWPGRLCRSAAWRVDGSCGREKQSKQPEVRRAVGQQTGSPHDSNTSGWEHLRSCSPLPPSATDARETEGRARPPQATACAKEHRHFAADSVGARTKKWKHTEINKQVKRHVIYRSSHSQTPTTSGALGRAPSLVSLDRRPQHNDTGILKTAYDRQ
jgi:hypothetical protein